MTFGGSGGMADVPVFDVSGIYNDDGGYHKVEGRLSGLIFSSHSWSHGREAGYSSKWIASGSPTTRELARPLNTSPFGRSRPAADATREVREQWLPEG